MKRTIQVESTTENVSVADMQKAIAGMLDKIEKKFPKGKLTGAKRVKGGFFSDSKTVGGKYETKLNDKTSLIMNKTGGKARSAAIRALKQASSALATMANNTELHRFK